MDLKEAASRHLEEISAQAIALSHSIHARPELGFAEHEASRAVAEVLDGSGFAVDQGAGGLPTALAATCGSGELTIGLFAEYDALPQMGHACGHNIIAAAAVTAARLLAPMATDLTVKVFGTPAEEAGGGKILMLDRGVFDGVHAAMMVHPSPADQVRASTLAVAHLGISYTGRTAHAGAAPEQGVNAADAFTVAQVAIGLLRQHLSHDARIHGIVTRGGEAPNVVPGLPQVARPPEHEAFERPGLGTQRGQLRAHHRDPRHGGQSRRAPHRASRPGVTTRGERS
jgi:amidohydrolase